MFAGLAIIGHVVIQKQYHGFPLIGDEWYYASPIGIKDLLYWPAYSFGHPPGWHFLHAIIYRFFEVEVFTLRMVGLFFSVSFLVMIAVQGWARRALLPASAMMLVMVTHFYFDFAGSLDHPVIATALFGFSGLIFAHFKKWWPSLICLSLAVFLRESALVFLGGVWFLLDSPKKHWKVIVFPFVTLMFFYLWNYWANKNLLMNFQARTIIDSGGSPWVPEFSRLGTYFDFFVGQLSWPVWVAMGLAAMIGVWGLKSSGMSRLSKALLAVFVLHTFFFGFYIHQAHRNPFIGIVALLLLIFQLLETAKVTCWKLSPAFVAVLIGLVASGPVLIRAQGPSLEVLHQEARVNMFRSAISSVHALVEQRPEVRVMVTTPLDKYSEFPWFGYTEKPLKVSWYGGHPGSMELKDFDVTLVRNPPVIWPEKDLLEYAESNDFELHDEIMGYTNTMQIWVRKQSEN